MGFTKEQKEKALLAFGWEKSVGYLLDDEPCDEGNTFVSLEDLRGFLGTEAGTYWSAESNPEYLRDLDDAWECLYDELFNKLDTEIEHEVEAYIREKIK